MRRLSRVISALPVLSVMSLMACAVGDVLGPITELPRELTVAETELVDADNRFAFKLFRAINEQEAPDRNVFISPLSVAMALGMTYNGAAGTTRVVMARALELEGMTIDDVNHAYRDLIDLLRALDPRVELVLANSIWHRPQFTPLPVFLEVNRQFFDAEVQALDFARADAATVINQWVEGATRGKIPTIVPDPIPIQIAAYLINAVYFKGDWTQQFDKDRTRDGPFRLAEGGTVDVPMMSRDEEHAVRLFFGDVVVLDVPYGGGAYSMTVVLPPESSGAQQLATALTREQWDSWVAQLDSSDVFVSLPKFSLDYAIRLNDVLKALGMEEAFDPCRADFSNMFVVSPDRRFWIDDVRHKTFVDVNEEGTEAAAATSVGIGTDSAPLRILVDRPFLFAIRERFSGTILFMGKIMNPVADDAVTIESEPEQCVG
jgi:serpin B